MSAIDCYKHEAIGRIGHTPIYRLLQDVGNGEHDFDGKKGDVLLGGGGGEVPAMRISIPEAFTAYFGEGYNFYEVTKCFWSWNNAYDFINEYKEVGYNPDEDGRIECWLTENILSYLLRRFPDEYLPFIADIKDIDEGEYKIDEKGYMCSYPNPSMIEFSKPIGSSKKNLTPQMVAEEFMCGLVRFGEATLINEGVQAVYFPPTYYLQQMCVDDLEKFLVELLDQPVHYMKQLVTYIIKDLIHGYRYCVMVQIMENKRIKEVYNVYRQIVKYEYPKNEEGGN